MSNKAEAAALMDFKISGFGISSNNGPIQPITNLQEAIAIYNNQNN